MPFPIDLTRCLAFAPADVMLKVQRISSPSVRQRLAQRGLVEGDEVRCEDSTSSAVLLRKADGGRVLVERDLALLIEVEPEARAAADDHRAASDERPGSVGSRGRRADPALPR